MDDKNKNISNKPTPADQGYAWLENMPEAIWNWLVSSELTYSIIALNRQLGFEGVKISVIPDLIMQIALKELPPEKLTESLAKQLNLDALRAAAVAKEIEEKMLRPIEIPLRRELGIDIKMIYAGIQSSQPKPVPPFTPPAPPIYRPTTPMSPVYRPVSPPAPLPTLPPLASPSTTPKEMPVKINVQPVRPAQGEKPLTEQPFGSDSWVNKIK